MTPARGDGLLHPAALAAVVALALNDHWWKHAAPGALTGKLSDVAGLCFFPLALQGAWELVARPRAPSRTVLWACALATAVGFALVKTVTPAAWLYRVGLAALQWPVRATVALARGGALPSVGRVSLTMDVTDLVALPAVLVAVAVGWRRAGGSWASTPPPPPPLLPGAPPGGMGD